MEAQGNNSVKTCGHEGIAVFCFAHDVAICIDC
jgi:hypothetical protein